jgi:hypothetical protein
VAKLGIRRALSGNDPLARACEVPAAQSRHQGRAIIDYSLIDIVAVHYDAAFGEQKNMEGLFMARPSALRA